MPVLKQNFRNRIELSRQEMCIISQVISRDFSPRFFSGRTEPKAKIQFSTQELLEISRQGRPTVEIGVVGGIAAAASCLLAYCQAPIEPDLEAG